MGLLKGRGWERREGRKRSGGRTGVRPSRNPSYAHDASLSDGVITKNIIVMSQFVDRRKTNCSTAVVLLLFFSMWLLAVKK